MSSQQRTAPTSHMCSTLSNQGNFQERGSLEIVVLLLEDDPGHDEEEKEPGGDEGDHTFNSSASLETPSRVLRRLVPKGIWMTFHPMS